MSESLYSLQLIILLHFFFFLFIYRKSLWCCLVCCCFWFYVLGWPMSGMTKIFHYGKCLRHPSLMKGTSDEHRDRQTMLPTSVELGLSTSIHSLFVIDECFRGIQHLNLLTFGCGLCRREHCKHPWTWGPDHMAVCSIDYQFKLHCQLNINPHCAATFVTDWRNWQFDLE